MLSISTDFQTLYRNIDALAKSFSDRSVTLVIHEPNESLTHITTPPKAVGTTNARPKTTEISPVPTKIATNEDEKAIIAFHDDLLANFEKRLISAKEAALKLNIREARFKTLFIKLYEKPYYQYFLQQKLQLAKKYLEEGRYHVHEVSNILGYSQPTKFVTVFKKHFGVTPGKLKVGKKGNRKHTSKKTI